MNSKLSGNAELILIHLRNFAPIKYTFRWSQASSSQIIKRAISDTYLRIRKPYEEACTGSVLEYADCQCTLNPYFLL